MKVVIDNAAGPTGVLGIILGLLPNQPKEWLIFFSTGLVICQLIHWIWRFIKWVRK